MGIRAVAGSLFLEMFEPLEIAASGHPEFKNFPDSLVWTDRQSYTESHPSGQRLLALGTRSISVLPDTPDLRPQLATMLCDNLPTEHESEARARCLGREKRGKELLKFFRSHSFTTVNNLNPEKLPAASMDVHSKLWFERRF
jgi:hypothetical protein